MTRLRWCVVLMLFLGQPVPNALAQGPPLYTPDDLMFLTHMIMHHEQALEMAALVPSTQR